MSFAYWLFTFFVLGSFPVVFYFIQVFGLSKLPNVVISKTTALILWVIVGIVSCLFAWILPMAGIGAILSWCFELFIMCCIFCFAFKDFEDSILWSFIKKVFGL